jgi:hypothetical protein
MPELEYLRPSWINEYVECPSKFYFDVIERIKVPNKLVLAFGTSTHETLKENFRQKIDSREDLPVEHIKDIFSSMFDREFQNVDPIDLKDQKPGNIKDGGIRLVEKYMKEIAYRIFPVMVEKTIRVNFDGLLYGLQCTPDGLDEDSVVFDHKTSLKNFVKLPEAYKFSIGGAYPVAVEALTGKPVKQCRADYLIRPSDKNPDPIIRNIEVPIDRKYFFSQFQIISKAIKGGIFTRTETICIVPKGSANSGTNVKRNSQAK